MEAQKDGFSALLLLPLFEWPQPAFVSSFVWINSALFVSQKFDSDA